MNIPFLITLLLLIVSLVFNYMTCVSNSNLMEELRKAVKPSRKTRKVRRATYLPSESEDVNPPF